MESEGGKAFKAKSLANTQYLIHYALLILFYHSPLVIQLPFVPYQQYPNNPPEAHSFQTLDKHRLLSYGFYNLSCVCLQVERDPILKEAREEGK